MLLNRNISEHNTENISDNIFHGGSGGPKVSSLSTACLVAPARSEAMDPKLVEWRCRKGWQDRLTKVEKRKVGPFCEPKRKYKKEKRGLLKGVMRTLFYLFKK